MVNAASPLVRLHVLFSPFFVLSLSLMFDAFQRVQDIFARVVTQSARCSNAKPLLESLH